VTESAWEGIFWTRNDYGSAVTKLGIGRSATAMTRIRFRLFLRLRLPVGDDRQRRPRCHTFASSRNVHQKTLSIARDREVDRSDHGEQGLRRSGLERSTVDLYRHGHNLLIQSEVVDFLGTAVPS